MTISILGTSYEVEKKKYDEDPVFERNSFAGYCDEFTKRIVYCDMTTHKGYEHEEENTLKSFEKQTLRHEIVHAFLNESGLSHNAVCAEIPWAKNEEMIDWIAIQGEKIYEAWRVAGAI